MIDVPHNGNNRRTRLCFDFCFGELGIREKCFGTIQRRILGNVTQLLHDDHRGFLVQHLIDGYHIAHFHQSFDNLSGFYRHFLSQRTHGNGLGHHHLMHNGFCWRRETMGNLIFAGSFSVLVLARTPSFAGR